MSFAPAEAFQMAVPRTVEKANTPADDWTIGALLIETAGLWAECGADPALVGAIALSAVGAGAGSLYPIGRQEFPPGFCQAVAVSGRRFTALYTGTLPSITGGTYGVTKGGDGIWRVDFAKTGGTARVQLMDISETKSPLNRKRVTVQFLTANVQVI